MIFFLLNKNYLMRCYHLNFTKYRFNKRRETSRKKRNTHLTTLHLITSCTYIIWQYTIVFIKIVKLSTKRSFIVIYKSWSATWQNAEMLFLTECSAFLNEYCFFKEWATSLYTMGCKIASEFSLHSRCHDIKRFEIYH